MTKTTDKPGATCAWCGHDTAPESSSETLCGVICHDQDCLAAHAATCEGCQAEHQQADPEAVAGALRDRIAALGYDPSETVFTLTLEDVLWVLANQLVEVGLGPNMLTQDELNKLVEEGKRGLGGEGMPWYDAIYYSVGEAWPSRLRQLPQPYVEETENGWDTRLFWQCQCVRIHTFRDDRCATCHGYRRFEASGIPVSEALERAGDLPPALVELLRQACVKIALPAAETAPDRWLEQAFEDRVSGGNEIGS